MKEGQRWFDKAKEDLETARFNFKGRRYDVAAFFCQQAVERALKALSINKKGEFRKIHDLKLLAKEVELPKKFIPFCEEISLAYVYSRYPDVAEVKEIKFESEKFIKNSELILKWIEEQL